MGGKTLGDRVKLALGITGIPAASADDVMNEAKSYTFGRRERVARRARWWWVRLLIGIALLSVAADVERPLSLFVVATVLGAIFVLSGLMGWYLHTRVFATDHEQPK